MSEQLGFGEFFEEKAADRQLFLAIRPKGLAREEAVTLSQRVSDGRGMARPAKHLHVSLNGIERFVEVPERIVRAVDEACTKVTTVIRAPEITFTKVMPFGGGSLVMAGEADANIALKVLYQMLEEELFRSGAKRRVEKGFTPHLTMRYGNHGVPTQEIEPFSWVAREIELICSWEGRTHYDILGTWELAG